MVIHSHVIVVTPPQVHVGYPQAFPRLRLVTYTLHKQCTHQTFNHLSCCTMSFKSPYKAYSLMYNFINLFTLGAHDTEFNLQMSLNRLALMYTHP